MRTFSIGILAVAMTVVAAPAAAQSSFVSGPNAVTLFATSPFTWTEKLTASTGTSLPGTTATITFSFLATNAARTAWQFSYAVDNTSSSPSAQSRLGAFGFNSTTKIASVTAGTNQRFKSALNTGNFNGLGNRTVCLFSGPNCNGAGNTGVTVAEPLVNGTFTLNFANSLSTLALNNFVGRWQATGLSANGSNSGGGLTELPPAPGAVPEPSSWALMIAGFGAAGVAMRRRRVATVPAPAA